MSGAEPSVHYYENIRSAGKNQKQGREESVR